MIKQAHISKFKNFTLALVLGVVISTLLATSINAESRKRIYSLSAVKAKAVVTNSITAKLKSDLVNQNVKFQFRNIEEYKVVNGKVIMKGDGFCVLTKSNDKMAMKFESIMDSNSNEIAEIEYNFVDFKGRSRFAPSADEDNLMSALLQKLSKDFMTQDVVVAIDDSKGVVRSDSRKAMVGYGEVKIKNGTWKRVDFSVELNLDNKTAKKVIYKLN